jgi:hypothetical protein
MPYRRLPNTDKARSRALERAYKKLELEGPTRVPYTEATLTALNVFVTKFHRAIITAEASRNNQVQKNKEYTELQRKARMYVSHFIQVVNFGILRGELKPEIRKFYELEKYGSSLPPLNSDNDLLIWGKKLIEGDQKRIMSGGNPIYNPSIALVKVNYEKFVDGYRFQKILQSTTDRNSNLVIELRVEADQLILKLWNEIEAAFEHLPDQLKRKKAEQYGVVYVYRKGELRKMEIINAQHQLAF